MTEQLSLVQIEAIVNNLRESIAMVDACDESLTGRALKVYAILQRYAPGVYQMTMDKNTRIHVGMHENYADPAVYLCRHEWEIDQVEYFSLDYLSMTDEALAKLAQDQDEAWLAERSKKAQAEKDAAKEKDRQLYERLKSQFESGGL